jgi:transposase-like protein
MNPTPDPAAKPAADTDNSFRKALMEHVRSRGGTKAVDTKGLMQSLVKQGFEALLELEMEDHLGYAKHDPQGRGSGNSRNGHSAKTIRGDFGEVEIETPRDRASTFDPKIVAKRQTSVGHFGDVIVSLYARGMTTREIEDHLHER